MAREVAHRNEFKAGKTDRDRQLQIHYWPIIPVRYALLKLYLEDSLVNDIQRNELPTHNERRSGANHRHEREWPRRSSRRIERYCCARRFLHGRRRCQAYTSDERIVLGENDSIFCSCEDQSYSPWNYPAQSPLGLQEVWYRFCKLVLNHGHVTLIQCVELDKWLPKEWPAL